MLDSPSLCITYKALIVRYKRVPSAAILSPMSTNHGLSDELRGFVTGGEYLVRVGVIASFVFPSVQSIAFSSLPSFAMCRYPFLSVLRLLSISTLVSLAAAYSFTLAANPVQCQQFVVNVTGQGQPPYSLLVVPVGESTVPTNVVAPSGATSFTIAAFPYPAGQQVVFTVSHASWCVMNY